jgi:hypothetical protein
LVPSIYHIRLADGKNTEVFPVASRIGLIG